MFSYMLGPHICTPPLTLRPHLKLSYFHWITICDATTNEYIYILIYHLKNRIEPQHNITYHILSSSSSVSSFHFADGYSTFLLFLFLSLPTSLHLADQLTIIFIQSTTHSLHYIIISPFFNNLIESITEQNGWCSCCFCYWEEEWSAHVSRSVNESRGHHQVVD